MPKQKQKPLKAWKGLPSLDKQGWQYLFLLNPRTGQLAKIEVPKRFAFDRRGYEIPEEATNVRIKGVSYSMHKKENDWDSRIAKRTLNRLLSNGFQIIPPDRIGVKTSSDAKQFNPSPNKPMPKHNKAQQAQQGQGQPGQPQPGQGQGQPMPGQPGQGQSQPGEKGEKGNESQGQNGEGQFDKDWKNNQTPKPANEGKSDKAKKGEKSPAQQGQNEQQDQNSANNNQGGDSGNQQQQQQGDPQEDERGGRGSRANESQHTKESPEDKKAREAAEKEATRAAEEAERQARAAKAAQDQAEREAAEAEAEAEKMEKQKQEYKERKRMRRGSRRRLGKRVVKVDRYARGNAGNKKIQGVFSYGDIIHDSKIQRMAARSAELLSQFIGKSNAKIEYGTRVDVPDLIVRLESQDNPIPALERPNERPKMRIVISPDCSPSTHDWNGLACAWAIALSKNPDMDVTYCPNSNGDPVKISENQFLTLMKSSDIIIYLGDSDGMSDNLTWAELGNHVIALSTSQESIGKIPDWKRSKNMVHLNIRKYPKGILRYVTGVKDKVPATWVIALKMCVESLQAEGA